MNKLLYLSGNDLPFISGKAAIHQPRLKQIAYVGEDALFLGSNFLCFSKDNLDLKDKTSLDNKTNFDILMSIINDKKNDSIKKSRKSMQLVLSLIFPFYELMTMPTMLVLTKKNEETGQKHQILINNQSFQELKNIIKNMFCLNIAAGGKDYNPGNKMAEKLAKKFRERQVMLSKRHTGEEPKQITIINDRVSILVTAKQHTYEQLMEYTVYQLFDQFKRFERQYSYDMWRQAKLAGAEGLQDVQSWLTDEEDEMGRKIGSSRSKIQFD